MDKFLNWYLNEFPDSQSYWQLLWKTGLFQFATNFLDDILRPFYYNMDNLTTTEKKNIDKIVKYVIWTIIVASSVPLTVKTYKLIFN